MSEDTFGGESCTDNSAKTTASEKDDSSQEERDEMLEAFTFYDKDGDGLITTREIATVMRALGFNPTVCEETDIVAQFALEHCSDVDFRAFAKLVKKRTRRPDEDYELKESFRRFDKEEKGTIEIEWLRSMLTTIGEPLTHGEVDEWLFDAAEFIDNGHLKYEEFATFMLSK